MQSPSVSSQKQSKLFNDCNFLGLNQSARKTTSSNASCIVAEPPLGIKKLLKTLGKKTLPGKTDEVEVFDLARLIQQWQNEEDDDFLILADVEPTIKNVEMLDLASLKNKFNTLYSKLVADFSSLSSSSSSEEEEEKNEEEKTDLFETQKRLPELFLNEESFQKKADVFMVVDETVMVETTTTTTEKQPIAASKLFQRFETSLNELFSDSDSANGDEAEKRENLIVDDTLAVSAHLAPEKEEKSMQDEELLEEVLEFINETMPIKKAENKRVKEIMKNSTPMRSILKHSPSPMTHKCTPIRNGDASMVGITQALELLKSTMAESPEEGHSARSSIRVEACFDMKTTLHELFVEDEESTCIEEVSSRMEEESRGSHRRLRFDEQSIVRTREERAMADDEDSMRGMKRGKAMRKVMSSDDDEEEEKVPKESNSGEFEDFYEVLGENEAASSHSESSSHKSTEESEQDSELSVAKNIKKKAAKYFLDEAEQSGEKEEDESNGDEEDGYDMEDSFMDRHEYSHNESMLARYQASVRNAQPVKAYLNRPLPPITADIFSQMPTQDASQYAYDSFLIADDQVSIYEKKRSKKSKKKSKKKAEEEERKNYRRVKCLSESASSPDERAKTVLIGEDEASVEKEFEVMKRGRRRNLITDSMLESQAPSKPLDESGEVMVIEERKTKADFSLVVIEEDEEPVVKEKTEPRVVREAVVSVEAEEEDDDFNKWLAEESFSEKIKTEPPKPLLNVEKATAVVRPFSVAEDQSLNKTREVSVHPFFDSKASRVETSVKEVAVKEVEKNPNWILIDAGLLTSAADIVKNLRKLWENEKILIQPSIGCDFLVSQRCAAIKLKWSELGSPSNRDQLIERLAKTRALYQQVLVVLQDDRELNSNRTRSKYFDSVLASLSQAHSVLFSKYKTDEACEQLSSLSRMESSLGFGIDLELNRIMETRKKEIAFYLSLPNVSIINALYFSKNYATISKFCSSSLEDLKCKGKMNERKAKKLLRFLIDSS